MTFEPVILNVGFIHSHRTAERICTVSPDFRFHRFSDESC